MVNLDSAREDPLRRRRARASLASEHNCGGERERPQLRTALAIVARRYDVPTGELKVNRPEALDLRLPPPGRAGLDRPTLVWRMEVTASVARADQRARPGRCKARRRRASLQPDRRGEEPQNLRRPQHRLPVPCTSLRSGSRAAQRAASPMSTSRTSTRATSTTSIPAASGATASTTRASALISTVRACDTDPGYGCPMDNGFWDGNIEQVILGTGNRGGRTTSSATSSPTRVTHYSSQTSSTTTSRARSTSRSRTSSAS